MKVLTQEGPIERDMLEVSDHVSESEGSRIIATEWRREGRLIRRDVWVSVLMPAQADVR